MLNWFGSKRKRNVRVRAKAEPVTLLARAGGRSGGRRSRSGTLRTALAIPFPAVQEKLRRAALTALLVLGTAAVLLVGARLSAFYGADGYWQVRQVGFTGQQKVNEALLRDTWARYLQTVGLPAEPRIFDLDLELLRSFYLGQITALQEVKVVRRLPDRIEVQVTERQPVALVRTGAAVTYQVDAGGTVFAIVDPADCRYPVLTGLDPGRLVLGRAVDDPALQAGLGLLAVLDRGWLERISEVQVASPQELVAWVDGNRVLLGDGGYREKFTTLNGILQQLGGRRVEYIDLHSPQRPAVKPLGDGRR